MNYQISNKYLKVIISSLGAETISIIKDNQERLWQNENGTWSRHAPILFPYAGKCFVIINGKNYGNKQHGFLRDQEFELVSKDENKIELSFKSNNNTLNLYPYDFKFNVIYEIKDFSLIITYKIINTSDSSMYFGLGGHESFAVKKSIDNYYVVFEEVENLVSITHEINDNLGISNIIDLASPLLNNSDSITLKNIKSKEVSLYDKFDNTIIAKTRFDGFSNFLLWHSPHSKMICMEPWINLPDKNKEDELKEFKDKENIIKLEPNNTKEFKRVIYYY